MRRLKCRDLPNWDRPRGGYGLCGLCDRAPARRSGSDRPPSSFNTKQRGADARFGSNTQYGWTRGTRAACGDAPPIDSCKTQEHDRIPIRPIGESPRFRLPRMDHAPSVITGRWSGRVPKECERCRDAPDQAAPRDQGCRDREFGGVEHPYDSRAETEPRDARVVVLKA